MSGPTNGETPDAKARTAIDVHAHAVPSSLLAELAEREIHGFSAHRTDKGWVVDVPGSGPGSGPTRPVGARMTDVGPRREWMARTGVTEQLLSPWMDVQTGELEPAAAIDWARRLNDAMAETAAELGGGTRVLASVPAFGGDAAAAALEEVRSRPEMAGVLLTTSPEGAALHDKDFEPFWAAAAEGGVPVVLHPPTCGPSNALPTLGTRGNVHGRLIDNTVAVAELILHGLLDRHPELTLILVHGGGYLPYQAARLDGGYRTREAFAGELERGRPSAYLPSLYYDTAALSGPAITFLARLAGADRVLLGSDYPFPLSDPEPVRTVLGTGLEESETAAILGGNAETILPRAR